ncbi:MAG: nucleotidyl transferase AbiEii/AbiGii toxin family protein [Schleiferilactobacillus harbinensis]|jgi:predicted nucleotidyltransferase component of viral defense system|nr:nucleotidyl transferase AbiEii/AbiGii toxin family protein [Schleiferilactobacillus harbinensis]MCI1911485.1 nucleotidyl transferase AbiEii/AbiGii toxin family protein [Schleiferilactobacillus harbinensis]
MIALTPQQRRHKDLIRDFLVYVNDQDAQYVLRGGTALMVCYGLDRFSEDVNLDGHGVAIRNYVSRFAQNRGIDYHIVQDTDTVKQFVLQNGNDRLGIETVYRRKYTDPTTINKINGISVYNLDALAIMKNNACQSRNRIRDLYDLIFILTHHWDDVSKHTKATIADAFSYHGLERLDYDVKTQQDVLIPEELVDQMTNNFPGIYDRLGLAGDTNRSTRD